MAKENFTLAIKTLGMCHVVYEATLCENTRHCVLELFHPKTVIK